MVGSSALLEKKAFTGSSAALGRGNGSRVNALFKVCCTFDGHNILLSLALLLLRWPDSALCVQGGTKQLKKAAAPAKKAVAPAKKAIATPIKKAVPKKSVGTQKVGRKGSKSTGAKMDTRHSRRQSPCIAIRARDEDYSSIIRLQPHSCSPSTYQLHFAVVMDDAQVRHCGCQTLRGLNGWTALCQETGASTPLAWPSPQSTCR